MNYQQTIYVPPCIKDGFSALLKVGSVLIHEIAKKFYYRNKICWGCQMLYLLCRNKFNKTTTKTLFTLSNSKLLVSYIIHGSRLHFGELSTWHVMPLPGGTISLSNSSQVIRKQTRSNCREGEHVCDPNIRFPAITSVILSFLWLGSHVKFVVLLDLVMIVSHMSV